MGTRVVVSIVLLPAEFFVASSVLECSFSIVHRFKFFINLRLTICEHNTIPQSHELSAWN
jgi:hypothetical protein